MKHKTKFSLRTYYESLQIDFFKSLYRNITNNQQHDRQQQHGRQQQQQHDRQQQRNDNSKSNDNSDTNGNSNTNAVNTTSNQPRRRRRC